MGGSDRKPREVHAVKVSLTDYALRLIAKARAKEAIEKLVQTPEARKREEQSK